jgi:hypothetical protein
MPGVGTLAGSIVTRLNQRRSRAIIIELDEREDRPVRTLPLQYYPNTLSDTKSVNYQQKSVPGGSLPLYQWVDSGERLISFTAEFTTDNDLSVNEGLEERLASAGEKASNIDIRAALVWLRRFMFPTYGERGDLQVPLTYAPRKLRLSLPNSKIGLIGCTVYNGDEDSVLSLMTQCDITYESFFPSGNIRIATVQLAFAQIPQLEGNVMFPGVTSFIDDYVTTGYTQYVVMGPGRR